MKTINVTDEQYEFLMSLSKELHTQDNRITANPIFCVYQKKRVYVPDGCGDKWGWFDNEGNLQNEEDIKEICEDYRTDHPNSTLDDEEIFEELDYRKADYNIEDVPIDGQVYFSEKAAQNHIDCNHYHYKEPFTYVDSAWRNNEWINIRKMIMDLPQKENK